MHPPAITNLNATLIGDLNSDSFEDIDPKKLKAHKKALKDCPTDMMEAILGNNINRLLDRFATEFKQNKNLPNGKRVLKKLFCISNQVFNLELSKSAIDQMVFNALGTSEVVTAAFEKKQEDIDHFEHYLRVAREEKDYSKAAIEARHKWMENRSVSLKKLGCRNAEDAICYVINNKLKGANLVEFPDLTNQQLNRLAAKCPHLEYLFIKSDQIRLSFFSAMQYFTELKEFSLSSSKTIIIDLTCCKKLEVLDLYGCVNLESIRFFKNKFIQHIKLHHCPKINYLYFPKQIPNLKGVDISFCSNLKSLQWPESGAPALEKFFMYFCEKIQTLTLPEICNQLEIFSCKTCKELEKLSLPKAAWGLKFCTITETMLEELVIPNHAGKLQEMTLMKCPQLRQLILPSAGAANVKYKIEECNALMAPELPSQNRIGNPVVEEASSQKDSREDKEIEVRKIWTSRPSSPKQFGCQNAQEAVDHIIKHNLTSANLIDFPELTNDDLRKLINNCPQLRSLFIDSPNITPNIFENLVNMQNLRELSISSMDFEGQTFPGHNSLEILILNRCFRLKKIDIGDCISLKSLNCSHCKDLGSLDLKNVRGVSSLQELNVTNCPNLSTIPFNETCDYDALKLITIEDCRSLGYLQLLNTMVSLEKLICKNCRLLWRVTFPKFTKGLKSVALSHCAHLNALHLPTNLYALKKFEIIGCHQKLMETLPLKLGRLFQQANQEKNSIKYLPKSIEADLSTKKRKRESPQSDRN